MRLCVLLVCLFACAAGAPPTCYSRALSLSRETMDLLERVHVSPRTKACARPLPPLFLDVHNACVTLKLRDFLYVLLNHPEPQCRQRPRLVILKRKIQMLYDIITRLCHRDLVFFTDDCDGIDTGHSRPYNGEDRLQLLIED